MTVWPVLKTDTPMAPPATKVPYASGAKRTIGTDLRTNLRTKLRNDFPLKNKAFLRFFHSIFLTLEIITFRIGDIVLPCLDGLLTEAESSSLQVLNSVVAEQCSATGPGTFVAADRNFAWLVSWRARLDF
jgi:hypothetical protein